MYDFLNRIFCKKVGDELGEELEKESKAPSRNDRYFKFRVSKYYGLQGIEWRYTKAMAIPSALCGIYSADWEIIDYCIDYFMPTTPIYLIKPRKGIEITKEEYEANK